VKTPLYPFIIWLPKAHSDSPLAGSIILAATILKLATYGYIRVLINFLPDATHYFSPLIQTIAVITIIYASLSTIIQQDTKRLIAYSSVAQPNGPLIFFNLLSQTICGKLNGINPFYFSTNFNKLIKILKYYIKNLNSNYSNINIYIKIIYLLLVKILNNYLSNPQITKAYLKFYNYYIIERFYIYFYNKKELNMLVGISETTRLLSAIVIIFFNFILSFIFFDLNVMFYNDISNFNILPITTTSLEIINNQLKKDSHFYEWLAGLIDADGYFYIRKKNRLTSLVITFDSRDEKTAQMIKYYLNGKLQVVNGSNAIRFLLHKYEDIVLLINNLNGLIRTENRMKQFKLVCLRYGVEYKNPIKLEYNNGWLAGFFDGDGHISYNKRNGNLNICVTQKNKILLDELALLYNGKVYNHSKKNNAYRWVISKKENVLLLLNFYFTKYPSRTIKKNRLDLIKKFYELRTNKAHKATKGSILNKAWKNFQLNWSN
jgi:Proton-conducting membrane transporter/LAGLIDADG endonuclease